MKIVKTFLIISCFVLSSCIVPFKGFKEKKAPSPPDYSKQKFWAALPDKKDSADFNLPDYGIIDNQESAETDVFFIHPTTYRAGRLWNAKLSKRSVNKRTDRLSMKMQASVFNGSCKVYAPRYRQAALVTYIEKKGNGPSVFNLAYKDVKEAFLYYLKNYNNGRPFIIASHSQGTDHAIKLINEFLNDTVLRKRLVSAYIIGRPVYKDSIKIIPYCDSATQTGCVVTWNAVPWGTNTLFRTNHDNLVSVNPLTWKRDTSYAGASLNLGSLPLQANKIEKGVFDARVSDNGLLWVHRPEGKTGKDYLYLNSESFHVIEYSLFYMNIRENVKQRIDAYKRKQ